MSIEREFIVDNIKQKGFNHFVKGNKHDQYWLINEGKKTRWFIIISRGSGYKDYGDELIGRQARNMGIKSSDLKDFVSCKSNKEEFLKVLNQSSKQ